MTRFLQCDSDLEIKPRDMQTYMNSCLAGFGNTGASFLHFTMYHFSIQQRLMLSTNCSKTNCGKSSTPRGRATNTVIRWPQNFSGCFYGISKCRYTLQIKHLHHLFPHHQNCCSLPLSSSTESMPSSIIDIIKPLYKTRPIQSLILQLQSTPTTFPNTKNRTPRICSRCTLGKINPLSLHKTLFHRS